MCDLKFFLSIFKFSLSVNVLRRQVSDHPCSIKTPLRQLTLRRTQKDLTITSSAVLCGVHGHCPRSVTSPLSVRQTGRGERTLDAECTTYVVDGKQPSLLSTDWVRPG